MEKGHLDKTLLPNSTWHHEAQARDLAQIMKVQKRSIDYEKYIISLFISTLTQPITFPLKSKMFHLTPAGLRPARDLPPSQI